MYKVKNKLKDVRKFRDNKLGKYVYVDGGKYVLTNNPPVESDVWKISIDEPKKKPKKKINIEKTEQEDQLNNKEVKSWQQ